MVDPVIGSDGHTYERSVIEEWLSKRETSPMTNGVMRITDLKPNYALKASIEEWLVTKSQQSGGPPARSPIDAVAKDFEVTVTPTGVRIETDAEETMPVQMIDILDLSGSMGGAANQKEAEGDQMSRLDLVKHAVLTSAHLLSKAGNSSLQLIGFSSKASQLMPMKKMDADGIACVQAVLKQCHPGGGTNLWEGLRLSLEAAAVASKSKPNTNIVVNLFTDGEPTPDMLPLMGLVPTLKKKLASLGCSLTLNVFGFGYNLDSKLLEQICIAGGGTYGFIPDCSMVGTVFINATATALTTVTRNVQLTVGDKTVWVGSFQKGLPRHVQLEIDAAATEATITYEEGATAKVALKRDATPSSRIHLLTLLQELLPLKSARSFRVITDERLMALHATVKALADPLCDAIARDIFSDDDNEGQLIKCISREDWYNSWGINFLIAYVRALELEQCTNFKDKVLQLFQSEAFQRLQEEGIQIFTDLPAPTPSIKRYSSCGAAAGAAAVPLNMGNYVAAGGGCFWGYNFVKLQQGDTMLVKDIRKGDILHGGHKVKCVVYTPIDTARMCRHPGGLLITPWHPICIDTVWTFPTSVLTTKEHYDLGGYYNFVLESGHIAIINNVDVCTLGHGFQDNDVIRHPYFGTNAVLRDLASDPGFQHGYVVLNIDKVKRDPNSLLVTRIV